MYVAESLKSYSFRIRIYYVFNFPLSFLSKRRIIFEIRDEYYYIYTIHGSFSHTPLSRST